ncbi:MAG TPA: hypothetical protein VGO90_04765 [Chthoniobacteraceae bacterium]|jgi:hypothetical protein|nr:hypothetical protein [Chthoniobacteraceae bacterium]
MKSFLLLTLLALVLPASAQRVTVDDTARFLAGVPVVGPLQGLMHQHAWAGHAGAMNKAWAKKESAQLLPIRAWMNTNAPQYHRSSATMYYMFSGPDFLYANTFFPNADTYILCGTEPVGQVPDLLAMPPEALTSELAALRQSMSTMLSFHYFITKDMRMDLTRGHLGGTVPILYVFLARLGHTVIDTTYVKSPAPGVKITFSGHGGRQTLYYFKTDLSNGGGSGGFLKWCAGQGPGNSLLKAASYLMHTEGFSNVRRFLLEESRVIVQDDSGIPLRSFPRGWNVRCYGNYVQHAEMFGKYHQPDLAQFYAQQNPPALGFAFGYHWQKSRGMLMLGTRE